MLLPPESLVAGIFKVLFNWKICNISVNSLKSLTFTLFNLIIKLVISLTVKPEGNSKTWYWTPILLYGLTPLPKW